MKLFLIIAALLLGQYQIGQRSFVPPSSGCTVQADQLTGTNNETNVLGNSTGTTYGAYIFTAASSYTLCAVTVPLEKVGSPSYTLNAYIFSVVSTLPASQIGTGSANLATSSLTTSFTNVNFTGLNATIVNGTQYAIVVISTGAPNDFTNYAQWGGTGVGSSPPCIYSSATGSSWTCSTGNTQGILTTYHA